MPVEGFLEGGEAMKRGSDDQTAEYAKSPGESVQSVFARDVRPPPQAWRQTSYRFLGSGDIPVERYISPAWHALEVERVWRKTWQVACRTEEIPNVGDFFVYDIVDDSILIVRTADGGIKGYINACLHRGTMLCLGHGNVKQFRCPFHGFTWSLEGVLRYIPGQWDFPHIDRGKFRLPEVKVDTWGGFVFVNLNPDAASLRDYLEILPDHLDGSVFENRYKAIHVSQVVPCNWKVVQEAFIEGYHVAETHFAKDENGQVLSTDPIATFSHDTATQYDIWPDQSRHINRLMQVGGIPSQYIAHHIKSEQEIVDRMLRRVPEGRRPKLKPGESARTAIAEFNRNALGQLHRADLSRLSDSEVMDQNQYNIFPNFTVWPATNSPLCYRFRPFGNNPDKAIFEVWFLYPRPQYGEAAKVAAERRLVEGEKWASVVELGGYGPVIDQDMPNLVRIQKGLHATKKPGVTLANYQEVRIRHFHQTLGEYLKNDDAGN
jgi:phenylpropionate dioxygenase-like ring-hydroxylating dioxygenase large terminal subunit